MQPGSRPALAVTFVAFGPKHCQKLYFLEDFMLADCGRASRHEQDVVLDQFTRSVQPFGK